MPTLGFLGFKQIALGIEVNNEKIFISPILLSFLSALMLAILSKAFLIILKVKKKVQSLREK